MFINLVWVGDGSHSVASVLNLSSKRMQNSLNFPLLTKDTLEQHVNSISSTVSTMAGPGSWSTNDVFEQFNKGVATWHHCSILPLIDKTVCQQTITQLQILQTLTLGVPLKLKLVKTTPIAQKWQLLTSTFDLKECHDRF